MKASEVITKLQEIITTVGDLPVVVGIWECSDISLGEDWLLYTDRELLDNPKLPQGRRVPAIEIY